MEPYPSIVLHCAAIDDETPALQLISQYIEQTPFLKLGVATTDPIDALGKLTQEKFDLLFLDIQMPTMDGLTLTQLAPKETLIVFTTAFDAFALEGYKLNIVDYLLKPFNYTDFLRAASKANYLFALKKQAGASALPKPAVFVHVNHQQVRLDVHDILYAEGLKDYIKIKLASLPQPLVCQITLRELEARLGERFMRVHRSFIVNLDKIETISRSRILIGKQYIPVGPLYKPQLDRILNG